MNYKYYYITVTGMENKIASLCYFEVPKKHFDSLENNDYIHEYHNRKIIKNLRDNPNGANTPWEEGIYKEQLKDYKPRHLIAEIFNDEEYFRKHFPNDEEPEGPRLYK